MLGHSSMQISGQSGEGRDNTKQASFSSSDVIELKLQDFSKILEVLVDPKNCKRGRTPPFSSKEEVHTILVALVKYTGIVPSELCHYIFDKNQNKFDPRNSKSKRSSAVPFGPDLYPTPGEYNWRKVLALAKIDFTVTKLKHLGSISVNEDENSPVKQGRALAFFIKHLYLARGKEFNNLQVEELANEFVAFHFKKCFHTLPRDPSKIRLVIDCNALGLPPDVFPRADEFARAEPSSETNSSDGNSDSSEDCGSELVQLQVESCLARTKNLAKMLESGEAADVTFHFENDKTLKAHAVILIAESPFFSALFQNQVKVESSNRVVRIRDLSYEGMKTLLEFFYTGKPGDNWKELIEEVVHGAVKFELKLLKEFIDKILLTMCKNENAWDLLTLARRYGLKIAEKEIKEFIEANITKILDATS